jgi:hypothetical protein
MENSWNIGILYSRNVFRLAEHYLLVKLSFNLKFCIKFQNLNRKYP